MSWIRNTGGFLVFHVPLIVYLFSGVLMGLPGPTPSSSRGVSWKQTARWVCGRGAPSSGASPPRPPPTSSAPFTYPTPASGGPLPQMPKRLFSSPTRQNTAGPVLYDQVFTFVRYNIISHRHTFNTENIPYCCANFHAASVVNAGEKEIT